MYIYMLFSEPGQLELPFLAQEWDFDLGSDFGRVGILLSAVGVRGIDSLQVLDLFKAERQGEGTAFESTAPPSLLEDAASGGAPPGRFGESGGGGGDISKAESRFETRY
mmetsp:Transcript_1309/g.3414  ORF Transcript_1309/g.3414 Transcript_1309/m.3414 type:complete len:109 (-) Transcript_1309:133-459(-)